MAATDIGARNAPPVQTDDVDDLFDYEVPDDIFQDVNPSMDAPPKPAKAPFGDGKTNGGSLGLDEEIKVTKKRAPVPKLDEERLLSQAGVPKLRRMARERLKLKGKGHEFSDVNRLLDMYQLWLDDLYPRAKFADGLAMIEKLGHSKRMQTMRKEWINGGKPKQYNDAASPIQEPALMNGNELGRSEAEVHNQDSRRVEADAEIGTIELEGSVRNHQGQLLAGSMDHEDSLFISDDEARQPEHERAGSPPDDLDMLLAEGNDPRGTLHDHKSLDTHNFDDEMEAMADMEDRFW